MKVDEARQLIANKAHELWNECLDSGYYLNYDIIKNYLERVIEDQYFVSNMWAGNWLATIDKKHIDFLINAVTVDDLVIDTKLARRIQK